jgi:two-component system phosphate regulon sensor histidine kinase PhoR
MIHQPDFRNILPAAFVVVALLSLGVVQFQWVRSGIVVEKQLFDRELRQLLEATGVSISQEPGLAQDILELQRLRRKGQPIPDSIRLRVRLKLEERLRADLKAQQKRMPFSIALSESIWHYPLLVGDRFDWSETAAYRTYAYQIEGTLAEACACQLYLHLQLRDFLPHLLERLWLLLALTVLGVVLLLLGFVLLVRKVQREQQLVAVKNEFINTLTHELKTPVFSSSLLLKLAQQALSDSQPEQVNMYLGRLSAENQQLKTQIEQVLELASLEQPVYQLERGLLPVADWLQRTCTAFKPKVQAEGGSLQWSFSGPDGFLTADASHLSNALANLLDNALKYGGQPPVIQVEAKSEAKGVTLKVKDNGDGVPEARQADIFQKFVRLHTGVVQGFGLGLSYVQQVVRLHGGQAGVHNHSDGGAVFWLQLPDFEPGDTSPQQLQHG